MLPITIKKGTVIDEQGQPVVYANIALLSPQDSTLITGGVSNESGLFVIPCEQQSVLGRISFVGYKTIYKQCNNAEHDTDAARHLHLSSRTDYAVGNLETDEAKLKVTFNL